MNYLKKISSVSALLVLIVAVSFSTSHAQFKKKHRKSKEYTLSGKVIAAKSGQELANAKIVVMNKGRKWKRAQRKQRKRGRRTNRKHMKADTTMGYHRMQADSIMQADKMHADSIMRRDSAIKKPKKRRRMLRRDSLRADSIMQAHKMEADSIMRRDSMKLAKYHHNNMNNDTTDTMGYHSSGMSKHAMKSTMTDQDGTFTINGIPAGKYKVKVMLPGYKTWHKKMKLKKNTHLTVKLKSKK